MIHALTGPAGQVPVLTVKGASLLCLMINKSARVYPVSRCQNEFSQHINDVQLESTTDELHQNGIVMHSLTSCTKTFPRIMKSKYLI